MVAKLVKNKANVWDIRWKRKTCGRGQGDTTTGRGRLTRLAHLVKIDNSYNGDDLQVFSLGHPDVLHQKMLDSLIVQKYIKKKYVFYKKCVQNCCLLSLPEELQMMVINNLPPSDVITLTQTCKALKEFINRNYVESVILPLSPKNQKKLDGRSVLCIISSFDIMLLKKNEYINTIKHMNLKNLKRLKFNGPQYVNVKYHYSYILSVPYIQSLTHYLSQAHCLQCLDILVDNSKETTKIINIIAKKLLCLKEITIRSSKEDQDYPNSYNRNVNYIMAMRSNANCHPDSLLNHMLATILRNSSITTMRLKGFSSLDSFGNYSHELLPYDSYLLRISSRHLKVLEIQHCKFCKIADIDCENLVELDIECGYLGIPDLFDISRSTPNHLAYLLADNCPKLKRFCNTDIDELKQKGDGDWIHALFWMHGL